MRYKAKIDWWIGLLLHGTNVIMIGVIFTIPPTEVYMYLMVVIPMVLLIVWILIGSYYELRDDEIFSKMGPFFSHIKYESIKSLELKTNFLSSMAMTSQRIEIREHDKSYIRGTTFIGPVNREEFLVELKHRCKNLDSRSKYNVFDN
ncbi:MAG: PH domain-containing protein [Bacilli bacterium]|nr:PH domain-containing protein [Bacilli bacterium]